MPDPRASVVLVHYQTPEELIGAIDALAGPSGSSDAGSQGIEIIVVDNGGGEALVPLADGGRFRLIRNDENRGFAAAANQGLSAAQAPYVVFANPDLRLDGHALDTLLAYLDDDPGVGLVGPTLRFEDGGPQPSAFPFPTWSHFLWRRMSSGPAGDGLAGDSLQRPRSVEWLLGACLAGRREALEDLGGFDEDYFLYGEDMDLAWRAHHAGLRIVLFPGAEAMHRGNPIWDARRRLRVHEAQILFFAKTRGTTSAMLLRLCIAFVYALRYARHALAGLLGRSSPCCTESRARDGDLAENERERSRTVLHGLLTRGGLPR